jgi:hypothetical protein
MRLAVGRKPDIGDRVAQPLTEAVHGERFAELGVEDCPSLESTFDIFALPKPRPIEDD